MTAPYTSRAAAQHRIPYDAAPAPAAAERVAGFSAADIRRLDEQNKAASAALRAAPPAVIGPALPDLSHFLMYGQSLAAGVGSFPPKSLDAVDGLLMLGDAETAETYREAFDVTDGGWPPTLRPLVATVRSQPVNAPLKREMQIGLPKNAPNRGESPLIGAMRFARALSAGTEAAAGEWVGSNAAIGALTIEQLSKGARPDLTMRLTGAARLARDLAALKKRSYGVAGLFYLQGEFNYAARYGDGTQTTDKDGWKALFGALVQDIMADTVRGVARQEARPPVIIYQTGGPWTTPGVAIGQAQWEACREIPGVVLAAPAYAVPARPDGHLEPNGSRWLGMHLGRVWHETVVARRGWRPTSPLSITMRGRTILASFHVPAPPLRFRKLPQSHLPTTLLSAGFSVEDANGPMDVDDVRIVADTVVAIECARAPEGPAWLLYGDQSRAGSGNLADSDATVACDRFEYDPAFAEHETDMPALSGKPYPMWNWCVAFRERIGA